MKFSNELMEELDNIENFVNMPDSDPIVIAIQEKVQMELLSMERIRNMNLKLDMDDILSGVSVDNFTPTMYFYLFNHGLSASDIFDHLRVPYYLITKWKMINGLVKQNMFIYEIYDIGENGAVYGSTENAVLIKTLHRLKDVAEYLDIPATRAHEASSKGVTVKFRYLVEKRPRIEPSLTEALDYEEKETFGYWLSCRKATKRKAGSGIRQDRSDTTKILMADIFGKEMVK